MEDVSYEIHLPGALLGFWPDLYISFNKEEVESKTSDKVSSTNIPQASTERIVHFL